jgi:hypothetical protein
VGVDDVERLLPGDLAGQVGVPLDLGEQNRRAETLPPPAGRRMKPGVGPAAARRDNCRRLGHRAAGGGGWRAAAYPAAVWYVAAQGGVHRPEA